MAIRPIIILPDPKLRLVSAPIGRVDDAIRKLLDDMVMTMHDAPGIGLAAIQIAEPIRVLVVDLAKKEETPAPQYFINPEIVWSSEERSVLEEGCLSIPEYYAEVERPARVRARFVDRDGRRRRSRPRACWRPCCSTNRPSRRRAVHRPHLEAETRPGGQEIRQGRQTGERGRASALRPRKPPRPRTAPGARGGGGRSGRGDSIPPSPIRSDKRRRCLPARNSRRGSWRDIAGDRLRRNRTVRLP